MRRRAFLGGAVAAVATPALADETISGAEALSGDRFSASGAEFILADIAAPPLYRLTPETPPFFEASRALLRAALNAPVSIKDVAPTTRWGARVVHASAGGQSLQEALVREGAVRVAPQSDDYERIKRLLALEGEARAERAGLWALDAYAPFKADHAEKAVGAFNLVEGEVLRATKGGPRFYLNFGADFRRDFTASEPARLQKSWARAELDLALLASQRVRVRGFVEWINGPAIDLKHPLQVERLDGEIT